MMKSISKRRHFNCIPSDFAKLRISENESENKMTRYQDDFYDAINGEWKRLRSFQLTNREQVVYRP